MRYKGIEVKKINDKYRLVSPTNGTMRIFNSKELVKRYIDNAEAIDSHAEAMAR